MAALLRAAVALLGAAVAAGLAGAGAGSQEAAGGDSPVAKVVTLLEDLQTEIQAEGKTEAGTYDTFACFCKDKTKAKSDSITKGNDDIDTFSADIQEKTAQSEAKATELKTRQQEQDATKTELEETNVRCAKSQAEYEAAAADFTKAISSLTNAIQAMKNSKPALLATDKTVQRSLQLATALGLLPEIKRQAVAVFMQVDPADPDYKYRSQSIIDTLDKLLSDFQAEKSDLDSEWDKTKKSCDDTKQSLETKISENDVAMTSLKEGIETLASDIATARESLVNAESLLKDDQQYLQDLTQRCETSARDWDQRSQARADELEALAGALSILKENVTALDAVNKRALVQLERNGTAPTQGELSASGSTNHTQEAPQEQRRLAGVSPHSAGLSFLQQGLVSKGQLRGARAEQDRVDLVLSLLSSEGSRLGSAALSLLATHVASDPFGKVKTLIQQLIERLLQEATAEATKKGFCDTEVGKAEQDRDNRFAEAKKLAVELKALKLKQEELNLTISTLNEAVTGLYKALNESTTLRETEKKENIAAIQQAKEGAAAVKQAISVLKVFYKKTSSAKVLLQASPVDEDTQGPGFSGAYTGKQSASGGIIGLLEVIQSDFERTVKQTEASEKKAEEEYVEFDRTSKTDISGKETQVALDLEDLESTKNAIETKLRDLQTAQDLVDSALKTLEALKPTCIDTGMTYEERIAKREEEIAALKKALCILDPNGVEAGCSGGG